MAHGMTLHFDGFPPINLDDRVPAIPCGTYLRSVGAFNSQINDHITFNFPITPPAGCTSFANIHSAAGSIVGTGFNRGPKIISCSVSRTSSTSHVRLSAASGLSTQMRYAITAGSDFSGASNQSGAYGIVTGSAGVNSVLSNNNPPMRVVGRYTFPLNNQRYIEFDVPELLAMREGSNEYAFYIGISGNQATMQSSLFPKSGGNFNNGARMHISFFNRSNVQGGYVYGIGNSSRKPVTGSLYVLAAAPATDAVGSSTYGVQIRNQNGRVTMSNNSVPLFCCATNVQRGMGTSNKPLPTYNLFGSSQLLPANAQGKTILFPVGVTKVLEGMTCWRWTSPYYVTQNGINTKTVSNDGRYIIDNFLATYQIPFGEVSGYKGWDLAYTGTAASSYIAQSQRLGLVAKEDYWL